MRMPGIFIGHGSPMNAVENNSYTKEWKKLGKQFKPKAILMISAHWYTTENRTQDDLLPKKIDDMYGFPEELYSMKYPVHGQKALTESIEKSLGDHIIIDNSWGIDHGAWSVLVHMYPNADIPVVQLSVDGTKSPKQQYEIGRAIASLRDQGYMIIASGNVVHNLRMMNSNGTQESPWAVSFDDYIEEAIRNREFDKCINYLDFGEDAKLSVPYPDHYYPLLNLLGTVGAEDKLKVFNKGHELGCVSMTSYIFN